MSIDPRDERAVAAQLGRPPPGPHGRDGKRKDPMPDRDDFAGPRHALAPGAVPADAVQGRSAMDHNLNVSNWPLGRSQTRDMLAGLPLQGSREAWRCHDVRVHELPGAGCLRCVPKCY